MSRPSSAVLAVVGAIIVSACGSPADTPATVTVAESTVTVRETPPRASEWSMPDLTGRNLQDAQDEIQALTAGNVFFSGSKDLTGQGRAQLMDRNWQVCTSTPPPGSPITSETPIEFGVVRIDSESCP